MFFCKLRIAGELLIPDAVTKELNIQPDGSYSKGETKKLANEVITYNEGCWIKGIETNDHGCFNELILEFLQPFLSKKEKICSLAKQFSATLWISLYPDGHQFNFHLSPELIEMINSLGISVDITSMYLNEFYNA